jgi:hypothetical protein
VPSLKFCIRHDLRWSGCGRALEKWLSFGQIMTEWFLFIVFFIPFVLSALMLLGLEMQRQ